MTAADGTELVADAWLPDGAGPWPVLLQRLPYGRSVASSVVLPHPVHLARRGYAVVVQDVRGRGDSGGDFEPFVDDADDGAATVEWAAGLPFCDGRVAMYGFSYQGLNTLAAAARRPPSLRAIAVAMCAADPYDGWTYEGGCLQWTFVPFWADLLAGQRDDPPGYDLDALPTIAAMGDDPPRWFIEWLSHRERDDWWEARSPDLGAIDVPAFYLGGWHDTFGSAMGRVIGGIDAEAVIGPWTHMPWTDPGPAHERLIGFFDRTFGRGTPPARITFFTVGHGWRSTDAWPPPATVERWSVSSEIDPASRHGDGRLRRGAHEPGAPGIIAAEPLVPVPGTLEPGTDETATEDRRDVLCYTSDLLDAPLVVTGSVIATVTTTADVATHDVVVSLTDVDHDRRSSRVATGVSRAGPGAVTVTLSPTSHRFAPGHRLRLDVSASRFPAFDRNPQCTDVPPHLATRTDCRVAVIEVLSVALAVPVDVITD